MRKNRKAAHSEFNLMVSGHSNTGKSNFIKTLFSTLDIKKYLFPETFSSERIEQLTADPFAMFDNEMNTPTVLPTRLEIQMEERILLRLIDTPGLPIPVNIHKKNSGPPLDYLQKLSEAWSNNIIKCIEAQYESTLLEESKVKRNPKKVDNQTHCCLYFFDPQVVTNNSGLTSVDQITLARLSEKVNVIPCIAKSDLLSLRQLTNVKKLIMDDIKKYNIGIQMFEHSCMDSDDEDESPQSHNSDSAVDMVPNLTLKSITDHYPFALFNAEDGIVHDGEKILGREFAWGIADVTNAKHSDYSKLIELLFNTHMQELKDITREELYENWRTSKLLEIRASFAGDEQVAINKK